MKVGGKWRDPGPVRPVGSGKPFDEGKTDMAVWNGSLFLCEWIAVSRAQMRLRRSEQVSVHQQA